MYYTISVIQFLVGDFQIMYPVDSSELKEMIPMASFLDQLRKRWIEKTVYTRTKKPFLVSVEEIPPFLAPSVTDHQPVNTEIEKKSVYLTKEISGKQMLHILQNNILHNIYMYICIYIHVYIIYI